MMLFTSREYGEMCFGGRRFTQRFEIHKRDGKYLVFSIKRRYQPFIDPVDCQHTLDADFDDLGQAISFVEACIVLICTQN